MKPYIPSTRVAVRESLDDDLSDDIEDDVFIRDGKSIKVNLNNIVDFLFADLLMYVVQYCTVI